MRVLIVGAPPEEYYRRRLMSSDTIVRSPPLPLGYLAATLEQHGHQVRLLDLSVVSQGSQVFKRELEDFAPGLVGISSTTVSFPQSLRFARLSKEVLPDCPVVMGGCHVTFTAEQVLAENPVVDMVVRGEGEQTLQELADRIEAHHSLEGVLGLSYQKNGNVIHNPPRPFIKDLDVLPWPARHLMDMTLYNVPAALITSRGCPARCIFCAAGAMGGQHYRPRKPECVVDEMEHLHRQLGFTSLAILDDTFTASPRRLSLPVCAEIQRRGLKVTFACESRVDVVTPQLLESLSAAGCVGIQFGVESGSPRVLAALRKHITLDQVRQAIRCAVALGMRVVCSFILGHPTETEADALMTLDFTEELLDMGVDRIFIGPLIPYPGTDLYEHREAHGITLYTNDWSQFSFGNPIINTRYLSRERLRDLYVDANVRITRHSKAVAGLQERTLQDLERSSVTA